MIIFITGGSACGKSEYAESVAVRLFEEMSSNAAGICGDTDIKSEKSDIADRRCKDCGNDAKQSIADKRFNMPEVIYLATMRNDSKEADRRIARHRRIRGDYPYNVRECFSCDDLNRLIDEELVSTAENYENEYFSTDNYINTNSNKYLYKENNLIRNNNIINKKQNIILFDCLSVFAANVLFDEDFYINGECNEYKKTRTDLAADNICNCISRLAEVCSNLIIVADMVFSDGSVYDKTTSGYIELLGRVCRYAASAADDVVEVVCGIPIMIKGDDYEFLKIHRISDFDVYKDSNA
ncbi:MAG: hypothetical protein HFE90_02845 [Firmicutes bacterium]|nr:hypothetical protein [Bacillota bacterium]